MEARIIYKGPNWASKEGEDHRHVFGSQKLLYWQSRMSLQSLSTSPGSANVLDNFSRLPVSDIVKSTSNAGRLFGLEEQICDEQCPHIWSPLCFWCVVWCFYFLWAWRGSIFPLRILMLSFWVTTVNPHLVAYISREVLWRLKQTLTQMFCLFISGIRKSWFTLNMCNSKYILRSSTEGYSCRTHWNNSEQNSSMAFYGKKLYQLPFMVLATSLGTFWYTFVCSISSCYHWFWYVS